MGDRPKKRLSKQADYISDPSGLGCPRGPSTVNFVLQRPLPGVLFFGEPSGLGGRCYDTSLPDTQRSFSFRACRTHPPRYRAEKGSDGAANRGSYALTHHGADLRKVFDPDPDLLRSRVRPPGRLIGLLVTRRQSDESRRIRQRYRPHCLKHGGSHCDAHGRAQPRLRDGRALRRTGDQCPVSGFPSLPITGRPADIF